MSQLLKKSLLTSSIINRGNYPYMIHPLSDGFPLISPDLLTEVVSDLKDKIEPLTPFDKIVTVEAMGIPIATLLSKEMNVPFSIIRKRCYGLADEICVQQETGYSKSELFINGIKKNETIVLVDDIISTGGTFSAIIQTLQEMNVTIKAGFVIINKGDNAENVIEKTGVPLYSLVRITIQNNKVVIL